MNFKEKILRKTKIYMIKKTWSIPSLIIAQTQVIKDRLVKNYNLENITVIPNFLPEFNIQLKKTKKIVRKDGTINLLFLTYYYSHKNLEIFIELARIIRDSELNYNIIITIDRKQNKFASKFLKSIEENGLDNIIINIGPVQLSEINSVYNQVDGVLIPTLLESFSSSYIEAMYFKKTILTSNYDFAKNICKNSAFYFDPLDANSIIKTIELAFRNEELRYIKIQNGIELLSSMSTKDKVFKQYINLIEQMLN